jgi:RNA polymerase sigma-70 factor (ECF subfamily)
MAEQPSRDVAPLELLEGSGEKAESASEALGSDEYPTLPSMPWGDPLRVAKMVQEHSGFIWRLLRRFGVNESALDDATQQTFIVAARKLHTVPEGRERQFLCGISVRVASNHRRARGQYCQKHADLALDELESNCPHAEVLIERKQARHALDLILNSMTHELRTVFVLCELEGLTAPEAAVVVEAPVGTVSSRLRRAREQFHEAAGRMRQQIAEAKACPRTEL